jgi:transcriptional regulator with XRE-family HTH domain
MERRPGHDGDEFEEYLEESFRNPGFRAAYEDAEARSALLAALVKVRQSLGLTQTEISRRMQTSQSFVSDLENGATDPRLSTLQRYSRAVTARLRIRIDMPTSGPWLPADQGAYASGSRVTVKTGRSPEDGAMTDFPSGFAASWAGLTPRVNHERRGTITSAYTP